MTGGGISRRQFSLPLSLLPVVFQDTAHDNLGGGGRGGRCEGGGRAGRKGRERGGGGGSTSIIGKGKTLGTQIIRHDTATPIRDDECNENNDPLRECGKMVGLEAMNNVMYIINCFKIVMR